jgi:SsrA-binding protein
MARDRGRSLVAQNRKARHDYFIDDVYEAGLVLTGTEVKSLRAGRASLVDGYADVRDGEVWLHNVHIPEYAEGTWNNHEPRRARKLLLTKDEIRRLIGKTKETGVTMVPLSIYFKDGYAKVELALAHGKRAYDKRQSLAEAQAKREASRAMSAANRRARA